MWFLGIYTLLNAAIDVKKVQNVFRVSVAGVPLGILEAMVALGIIIALFQGGAQRRKEPTDRTHPMYVVCMITLMIGFIFGAFGTINSDAPPRFKMVFMREFFGMPASIFIGYRMVGYLRHARRLGYILAFAGVIVSIMVMVAFDRGAEEYELHNNMNALRTVSFITSYAGTACALLVFSVLSGQRLFRPGVALLIAGFCFIGQLTPLHRSDWLGQATALAVVPFIVPPGRRIRSLFGMFGVSIALVLFLWGALHAASLATGRNFHEAFEKRVMSMLPGDSQSSTAPKAWATRVPAIIVETQMFLQSPLFGNGFAAEEATGRGAEVGEGFHHNSWTSTACQTGLPGLTGVFLAVFAGPVIIGYKLIRANTDRASTIIGAAGVVCGVQQTFLGAATAGFNGYRAAMLIGTICGVVLRVREIQLTHMRMAAEYEAGYGQAFSEDYGDQFAGTAAAEGYEYLPAEG